MKLQKNARFLFQCLICAAVFLVFVRPVNADTLVAKNASVSVLPSRVEVNSFVKAYHPELKNSSVQDVILRDTIQDIRITANGTYHLYYYYAIKGVAVLLSQLYVAQNVDMSKRILHDVAEGILIRARRAKQSALILEPFQGLQKWQEEVIAFRVLENDRPMGIIVIFRRGINVGVVNIIGPAAPKDATQFVAFMKDKAESMLTFRPEFK